MVKCTLLISACYKLTFWRTFRCNFITAYLYNSNGLPLRGCVFKNKQSINTIIGHFVINFSGVLQDMGIDPEKVTGHVSAGDDVRKALIYCGGIRHRFCICDDLFTQDETC